MTEEFEIIEYFPDNPIKSYKLKLMILSRECKKCNEYFLDCKCDKVNHPSHYQGKKFEVIDIIDDFNLNFNLGNAIKYILRSGKKEDKKKDLEKAIWYLQREIER